MHMKRGRKVRVRSTAGTVFIPKNIEGAVARKLPRAGQERIRAKSPSGAKLPSQAKLLGQEKFTSRAKLQSGAKLPRGAKLL